MWLCRGCSHTPVEPVIIHDSISIHDTAYIEGKTITKYIVRYDTIREWEYDTLTEYAVVPIEAREYKDTFATDSSSIELDVHFSGYNAKIDSIGLSYTFTIEPRVVEKKRGWAFFVGPSVQVGYGVAFGSPVIAAPYVGVGVSLGWGYYFKK